MRLPRSAGLQRRLAELLNRKSIHVRAQPHTEPAVGTSPFDCADHSSTSNAAMNRYAQCLQESGDACASAMLLESNLRMGVKIASKGPQIVEGARDGMSAPIQI
jgi:hypothetical protein